MTQRRVVITFDAARVDAGLLAWAIRVFSDPEAPKDMTIRLERIPEDG